MFFPVTCLFSPKAEKGIVRVSNRRDLVALSNMCINLVNRLTIKVGRFWPWGKSFHFSGRNVHNFREKRGSSFLKENVSKKCLTCNGHRRAIIQVASIQAIVFFHKTLAFACYYDLLVVAPWVTCFKCIHFVSLFVNSRRYLDCSFTATCSHYAQHRQTNDWVPTTPSIVRQKIEFALRPASTDKR